MTTKLIPKIQLISIVINLLLIPKIFGKMEDFVIDVNDILSENLMPTSFFMVENVPSSANHSKLDENLQNILNSTPIQDHGTFGEAYTTMGFHRQVINTYMFVYMTEKFYIAVIYSS